MQSKQITSAQRKWFGRLERTLTAMPKGVEIIVESSSYDAVTVRLMPKGLTYDLEADNGHDRIVVVSKIQEFELASFDADSVIANSEGI